MGSHIASLPAAVYIPQILWYVLMTEPRLFLCSHSETLACKSTAIRHFGALAFGPQPCLYFAIRPYSIGSSQPGFLFAWPYLGPFPVQSAVLSVRSRGSMLRTDELSPALTTWTHCHCPRPIFKEAGNVTHGIQSSFGSRVSPADRVT